MIPGFTKLGVKLELEVIWLISERFSVAYTIQVQPPRYHRLVLPPTPRIVRQPTHLSPLRHGWHLKRRLSLRPPSQSMKSSRIFCELLSIERPPRRNSQREMGKLARILRFLRCSILNSMRGSWIFISLFLSHSFFFSPFLFFVLFSKLQRC